MFFLLRVAFWLTVVLVLLPTGGSQPGSPSPKVGTTEAVVAAGAAVSDMSNFCDRQPQACEVGAHAAVAIGQRAQAGARMVYDFINDRVAHAETGSVADSKLFDPRAVPALRGTLSASDLGPAWQGPPVRIEAVPTLRSRKVHRPKA